MAHTLADVTAAANDPYLRDRLISAAALNVPSDAPRAGPGIDSTGMCAVVCPADLLCPEQWVDTRMRLLAAAPVNAAGDTVASVYAYAVGQMPPPPGANPAAVTDAFLRHALADVQP